MSEIQFDHVVIAWDTTRARRAQADAKPLLKRASAATVIMITDEKSFSAEGGETLTDNLRGCGLRARLQTFQLGGTGIAQVLQKGAAGIASDCSSWAGSATRDYGTSHCTACP